MILKTSGNSIQDVYKFQYRLKKWRDDQIRHLYKTSDSDEIFMDKAKHLERLERILKNLDHIEKDTEEELKEEVEKKDEKVEKKIEENTKTKAIPATAEQKI